MGTYEVQARSDDGFARTTATVKGKSVAKVTLRNAGVGTIEGRVLDEATRGRGYAGLALEIQDSDVAVKSVVTGGPAERAGVRRGDIIREVGDFDFDLMQGLQWVLDTVEARGPGQVVKLTLERDGKERTVELKLEQAA